MKNFVSGVILLFIAWVLMSGNLGAYLTLVDTTRWHISAASLFAGVFGGGSSGKKSGGLFGGGLFGTIADVAGVAAAPYTGGASLAATTALNAGTSGQL